MAGSGDSDITITINIDDVEKYTMESILKAFEAIGLKVESYAKLKCPVDTGLLRNSIAHAVSGEQPSISITKKSDYRADHPDDDGLVKTGTYNGHVPNIRGDPRVYVGTNVYYAPYVEMGHRQQIGRFVPKLGKRLKAPSVKAQPYLRPAFTDHTAEYQSILESLIEEAMDNFNNS